VTFGFEGLPALFELAAQRFDAGEWSSGKLS